MQRRVRAAESCSRDVRPPTVANSSRQNRDLDENPLQLIPVCRAATELLVPFLSVSPTNQPQAGGTCSLEKDQGGTARGRTGTALRYASASLSASEETCL